MTRLKKMKTRPQRRRDAEESRRIIRVYPRSSVAKKTFIAVATL